LRGRLAAQFKKAANVFQILVTDLLRFVIIQDTVKSYPGTVTKIGDEV